MKSILKIIIIKLARRLGFFKDFTSQFFLNVKNQPDLYNLLNEIPSETGYNERLFLYWLSRMNSLEGNILEIGPFLGGTTRAIAMGINDNLFAQNYKLLTIDKFEDYIESSVFKKFGVESAQAFEDKEKISFYNLFLNYHLGSSYEKYIIAEKFKLPDKKVDEWNPTILAKFSPYSIVFVDGCKSWYSLKALFSEIAKKMVVGCHVIFQDYGRFTCFWISVFCEIFKEYFVFEGTVDSSHVYRYKGGLTREIINQLFTDSPNEWDKIKVNKFFDIMDKKSHQPFYITLNKIQRAGFLAYIGHKNQARAILHKHQKTLRKKSHEHRLVSEALIKPTYAIDQEILL